MNVFRMALPHDVTLSGFVREIKSIYRFSQDQADELEAALSTVVNTAAVNALSTRPHVEPAQPLVPGGVQDGPEFMRPDEVSVALGICVSTLAGWRSRGDGPAFRKVGKAVMYRREDVRAWVNLQGATPAALPSDLLHLDPSEVRQ